MLINSILTKKLNLALKFYNKIIFERALCLIELMRENNLKSRV